MQYFKLKIIGQRLKASFQINATVRRLTDCARDKVNQRDINKPVVHLHGNHRA